MKKTPYISDVVDDRLLAGLASAVVLQALADVQRADAVALDAALWLTGADAAQWLEWAGLPFADPFQLLAKGKITRRARYGKRAR